MLPPSSAKQDQTDKHLATQLNPNQIFVELTLFGQLLVDHNYIHGQFLSTAKLRTTGFDCNVRTELVNTIEHTSTKEKYKRG
jgi:hypothetical protein